MAEERRKKCVTQVKILWTQWVTNIKTHTLAWNISVVVINLVNESTLKTM